MRPKTPPQGGDFRPLTRCQRPACGGSLLETLEGLRCCLCARPPSAVVIDPATMPRESAWAP